MFVESRHILGGAKIAVDCYVAVEPSDSPLIAKSESYEVIGAFFDVYNDLGPGFPEFIARRAMAIGIREAGLEVIEEVEIPVWFRGQRIAKFRTDLIVANKLVVEVKVAPEIDRFHIAQVLHYLKATDFEVGLLLNFGREPKFRRVIYQMSKKRPRVAPPSPEELERELKAGEIRGDDP